MRRALRISLLALVLALALAAGSAGASGTHASFAIVDSTGGIPTATTFSAFGAGGNAVSAEALVGPSFTLTQPTVITEIGAFANNCREFVVFVPFCPDPKPFVVQIRPDAGGAPDPRVVLASFELSHDDDPFTIAYESAQLNLTLPPGRYFAMFTAQGDDAGFVLGSATIPFFHRAEVVYSGVLEEGRAFSTQLVAAFRVLGRPAAAGVEVRLTGPTRLLADGDVIVHDEQGRGHRLRADAAIAAQLAALAGRTMTVVGTAVEDPMAVPNFPILVRDFRVEPGGAFDGQDVSVLGQTARLPDGGVIVYDRLGHGHRLRGTGAVAADIDRLAGKHVSVRGTASVTNTAARLNWPIDVASIVEFD